MIESLNLRQLQLESARAIAVINNDKSLSLQQFNSKFKHDSRAWYKHVVGWYIETYGDLPSITGPGKDVVMVHDV